MKELNKRFGVYYTPREITEFSIKHIFDNFIDPTRKRLSILEPSVGDGKFVLDTIDYVIPKRISLLFDIVDISLDSGKDVLERANKRSQNVKINNEVCDFLEFPLKRKYDVIIGNPPFIGKRDLSKFQIELCRDIHEASDDSSEIKNIWTSFVYKCLSTIKKDGTLCLVLPIELLHVNYTSQLRSYLRSFFKRIDIFTFKEIVFENTQQDVILLFASNSNLVTEEGISFYEVKTLSDLEIPDYTKKFFNIHRKNQEKWSNYILTDSELEFIQYCKEKENVLELKMYCSKLEVGVVTAANKYFILNRDEIIQNKLSKLSKPIIQKSSYLRKGWILDKGMFKQIENNELPCWLVQFDNDSSKKYINKYESYLNIGINESLNSRFKMKKRENWYHVPVKWIGDAFLIKRIHNYPKLIINDAKVQSTDAMYLMKVLPIYDKYCLGISFYNVLTFIDCELKGRYYGGGVLELTPNEYKQVESPYKNVSESYVSKFNNWMDTESIEYILNNNSKKILSKLTKKEIKRLFSIHQKLIRRRKK